MSKKRTLKGLRDAYRFPHFTPGERVHGLFGDPYAVVITLSRRQKKRSVASVGTGSVKIEIDENVSFEIYLAAIAVYISKWKFVGLRALCVKQ